MLALLVLSGLTAGSTTPPQRAALTGVVQTNTGQPLRGASVFIRTAKPRQGVGYL
jgi:hypothetical protein